jgi:hypothetical protein
LGLRLPLRLNSGKTEHRYVILQLSHQQEIHDLVGLFFIENKYRVKPKQYFQSFDK